MCPSPLPEVHQDEQGRHLEQARTGLGDARDAKTQKASLARRVARAIVRLEAHQVGALSLAVGLEALPLGQPRLSLRAASPA